MRLFRQLAENFNAWKRQNEMAALELEFERACHGIGTFKILPALEASSPYCIEEFDPRSLEGRRRIRDIKTRLQECRMREISLHGPV